LIFLFKGRIHRQLRIRSSGVRSQEEEGRRKEEGGRRKEEGGSQEGVLYYCVLSP
jgi:hypothetical protein